jgi:hypothetical protein
MLPSSGNKRGEEDIKPLLGSLVERASNLISQGAK